MTKHSDETIAKRLAEVINSQGVTDATAEAHFNKINNERTSLGLDPLPQEASIDMIEPPDEPSCDACGKAHGGTLKCGKCHLAFYCSRECQVAGWKRQGHKQDCSGMKKKCETMGKQVVDQLSDTTLSPIIRVQNLERVDGEGPYRCARDLGLHQVIYDLMLEDTREVQKRFHGNDSYQQTFYCVWIMTTLFCGGRISRKEMNVQTTRNIDTTRVRDFLKSKEDAFEVWWDASMTFISQVVMDPKVFRNKPVHTEAHQLARNVLATWSQILLDPKVAKTILFGKEKRNVDHAKARATYIAESTKKTLRGMDERKDLRSVLMAIMNQNIAMVAYWCNNKYGVDINMEKMLGLKGVRLQMYRQVAYPLGEATIKKGCALNNAEAQVAMTAGRQGGKRN